MAGTGTSEACACRDCTAAIASEAYLEASEWERASQVCAGEREREKEIEDACTICNL